MISHIPDYIKSSVIDPIRSRFFGQPQHTDPNIELHQPDDQNGSSHITVEPAQDRVQHETGTTDVRVGTDYKNISLLHLLNLLKVDALGALEESAAATQLNMQENMDKKTAINELMKQLLSASGQVTSSSSIKVANLPDLQKAMQRVGQMKGISSAITTYTTKATLNKSEIDVFQDILKTETAKIDDAFKIDGQKFSSITEKRNTLYQTLIGIISTLKQTISKLFSR